MGATPGNGGTIRAQLALRQALDTATHILPTPEVSIAAAAERFDADGNLTDEPTRHHVARMLLAFSDWTRRLRP